MRLAVSETGYASAVEAYVGGNELAARAATDLVARLASSRGMAGNDSTAQDFAAAYDDAARATVSALTPLVGSFGSLARMAEASLVNHAHAERRSVLRAWSDAAPVPSTAAVGVIGVTLAGPPSALGAADTPPGGAAGMVLDVLQDVFWPNADTDRVRSVATVWRAAATQVHLLTAHCDSARWALADERSPEIPVALAVTDQLRERADALADQLDALADACDSYAAQVEAKRAELVDLLESLVKEFILGGLVVGGLSFLSGGAAAGLGGSAAAARIAAASREARGILDSLRVLASGTATTIRPVALESGALEASLGRTAGARVMLMEERGAAGAASRTAFESPTAWAERQTKAGGHMAAEHIGQNSRSLWQRLLRDRDISAASTFPDAPTAHRAVHEVLSIRSNEVAAWLQGRGRSLILREELDDVIGHRMLRSGEVFETRGVFMKLIRDPSQPEGFYVRTAFPAKVGP